MRYLFLVIMSFVVFGCTSNSDTEKFQSSRKDVVDVSENIKEWDTGDVLIGSVSRFYVGDEYLCIADYKSYDNSIHLFSLSDLNHVVSCGMIDNKTIEFALDNEKVGIIPIRISVAFPNFDNDLDLYSRVSDYQMTLEEKALKEQEKERLKQEKIKADQERRAKAQALKEAENK